MATRSRAGGRAWGADGKSVISYRHADKRKNNPEVGMVKPENDPEQPRTAWKYDPHIDPALEFDVKRAQIEKLIDAALVSGDDKKMRAVLAMARGDRVLLHGQFSTLAAG